MTESVDETERNKNKVRELVASGLEVGIGMEVIFDLADLHHDQQTGIRFLHHHDSTSESPNKSIISGYVVKIDSDSFQLVHGWNIAKNRPLPDIGGVKIYGSAVKEYRLSRKR